jgi:hypothetical protein
MSDVIPFQPNPNQAPGTTLSPGTGVSYNPILTTISPGYSPETPSSSPYTTNIKLETLFTYTSAQIRDTWLNMGQLEVNNITQVYTRNTVFRCVEATSPLNGCIFFCDADYTLAPTFTWTNMMVADATSGTIIDSVSFIVDPHFFLVLTQIAFQAITAVYNPDWVPFQEVNTNSKVIIDDDDLNTILTEIGVPFIKVAEMEYSRDDICNYMLLPAMKVFYKWFPIETVASYALPDANFKVAIPNWAFTATKAMLNPGYPVGPVPNNPLYRYFDEVLMSISPRGAFSTPNINSSRRTGFVDTMSFSTYILERAARQGIINYGTRQRIRIYIQQGYVTGYTTRRGVLEITWGSMSNFWSDIPMNRVDEVRDLAKAYVLRAFAMLRSQAKSDIPGTINYEHFMTRADALELRTLELWQSASKAAIVRAT